METQLRSLPEDLDRVYDRILSSTTKNPHDLKQFLTWLAFSARPLDVETLADVITVDFASNSVPFYDGKRQYFGGPKGILAVCSSFVVEIQGIFFNIELQNMLLKNIQELSNCHTCP